MNRVGQQLGNYRLVRLLGRGGFAEVYLGEHQRLQTQAAIKVLSASLSEKDAESFLKEAQFLARLDHPHIVRILDFDLIEDGVPFLIMGYAPYGTLRSRHPKETILPPALVVEYVKQIADALQYAHTQKIIHRDIKPENMLVGRRGEVLLSDFGIALIDPGSRYQTTQEVTGTMAYMAPEQIQGKPRPASDQYALGIVVYEWLSGQRPFRGSLTEIVAQHLAVAPTPLRALAPFASQQVQDVVMKALEKDPRRRFTNVQAFARALEHACHADNNPSMIARPHFPALHPSGRSERSSSPEEETSVQSVELAAAISFPQKKRAARMRAARTFLMVALPLLLCGLLTEFLIGKGWIVQAYALALLETLVASVALFLFHRQCAGLLAKLALPVFWLGWLFYACLVPILILTLLVVHPSFSPQVQPLVPRILQILIQANWYSILLLTLGILPGLKAMRQRPSSLFKWWMPVSGILWMIAPLVAILTHYLSGLPALYGYFASLTIFSLAFTSSTFSTLSSS